MGSSKSITIGYKYFIGMHMVVCHEIDELQAILAGDRIVFEGSVTDNTTLNINKPDLFGGEKKEGGIQLKNSKIVLAIAALMAISLVFAQSSNDPFPTPM